MVGNSTATVRHALAALAMSLTLTDCGGGSGGGQGAPAAPTQGTSPSGAALFQQPVEKAIAGNLVVPNASPITSPPIGTFVMVFWQLNPNAPNGGLVPSSWDASAMTGYTPPAPLSSYQLGFLPDTPGTTTAQMDGSTVGAYLNSNDLPGAPPGQKMMSTPQYTFPTGEAPTPFANSSGVLSGSLNLQVPVAEGDDTYVVEDLLFLGPNGVRLSYGVKLFANGLQSPTVGTNYDTPSTSYILNSPLGFDERFVSIASGSSLDAATPWTGWQYFAWSISTAQFAAALTYMNGQYPDAFQSTDPADYVFAEVHLNAEFSFQPGAPAQLGWSMNGLQLSYSGS
jgi:hypothetical protein